MLIGQNEWTDEIETCKCGSALAGRKHRGPMAIKGHETTIERGMPTSRQKQAIMDIQTLSAVLTGGPWLDMRGTEKRLVDITGHPCSTVPTRRTASCLRVGPDVAAVEGGQFGGHLGFVVDPQRDPASGGTVALGDDLSIAHGRALGQPARPGA